VIANFTGEHKFTSVKLTTGQIAFEWANAVVPLPAAGVLFATALAGLAWLRRRMNVMTPAVT
jgi:hypothetical protein